MRLLASLLLLAAPVASAAAGCTKDTTKTASRTVFGTLPVAALHIDAAGGTASINGESHTISEGRLAIAFCRWPSYTVSLVRGSNGDIMTTDYIAAGSQTFHPDLFTRWSGVELQKRWRDSSIFHPMVSLAVGRLSTVYWYSHRATSDGIWEHREEGASSARYFAPAAGVEMSLFKYMTSYLLVGFRHVGTLDTPGVARDGFDGQYFNLGFAFGKFR